MSGRMLQLSGIVVDLIYTVAELPTAGDDVESESFSCEVGGGFNAVASARRLGADVTYGGTLGIGRFADIAVAALENENVPVAGAGRVAVDQGNCVAIVDSAAERTFISHHGAEREVSPQHLQALRAITYDWLLLSGYSLFKPQTAAVVVPWAASMAPGPRLLFDPGPVVDRISANTLNAVLSRTDWLSVNAREAEFLTGVADPCCAAGRLAADRVGAIVRTGSDGCWVVVEDELPVHLAGFSVKAVDSNGAGDTHDGAFIAAMMRGLKVYDAALLANAAAAFSVTRSGPATAPNLNEIRAFLAGRNMNLPGLEAPDPIKGRGRFSGPNNVIEQEETI